MSNTQQPGKRIDDLTHPDATRKNIPSAEHQSVMPPEQQSPVDLRYSRDGSALLDEKKQRNPDLDPQLVWRGKDQQDWSDLVVKAPPLYIQEKVKPKVLIEDLRRETEARKAQQQNAQQPETLDLFGDFNGLPEDADRTEFYQHDAHWQNRMILGDSLQVMASLAEREALRGKVQCIYFDPPYGIKFNSNFQWSTTSRDVKDGNVTHITREPEQVKAFRDTWKDGIHSYLTYLRDRLTVARDLLTESGSIFVQIGDENVHRVRAVMDEVFGDENFISLIAFTKTTGLGSSRQLPGRFDLILWYAKKYSDCKYRPLYEELNNPQLAGYTRDDPDRPSLGKYMSADLTKPGPGQKYKVSAYGRFFESGRRWWGYPPESIERARKAERLALTKTTIRYKRFFSDYPVSAINNLWAGFGGALNAQYVVETNPAIIERCVLMSTDPGDLVLDPTCGSGTTAYVAEQWGRRWITIDTSRVALALARARIMGARYPYYLLADTLEGKQKEAEITRIPVSSQPSYGNITHGFVYERVPHITLKAIANNAEIDVIWDSFEVRLLPLRRQLTDALPAGWLATHRKAQKYTAEVPAEIQEWEVPREAPEDWSAAAGKLVQEFWQLRIARQQEIDASIAAKSDFEYLYDKPYEDRKRVRVAGPFTVESLSPHRVLGVDYDDELIDEAADDRAAYGQDFVSLILDNLRSAGVQQAHKEDKIAFTSLTPWPGEMICAEGQYQENGQSKRAAILVGPEFGTLTRIDLVEAAREAGDANFDVLIACAFSYDAQASEFNKLGRIHVLKARMNADLHMAEDLKNTGKGNLFVIFGEPDVDVLDSKGHSIRRYDGQRDVIDLPADGQLVVRINGVDVFDPSSGEIRSDDADGIACWFIDTDYNQESFFVRQAYFLGANDPYKSLKTTLKAEIDPDAWASLNSDTSRPFPVPANGRFAVKVINHLGDEVMKVFKV